MSWQGYVDNNLVGTGRVPHAAIYGLNGGCWAHSPEFELQGNELQQIINGFKDPSAVQGTGVFIQGQKYFVLKVDPRSIYGKKASDGICIVKTNQAILIGKYVEGIQPGECNKVVEQLADYLISVGYVSLHKREN
ncbi:profilin [Radiomyces spectabilis]|uniref:profilin n=1 Tax=Radiomyces spectabilis TaxID=64574 RepID=UPI0022209C80|nr:profilin [Radiomyces spectabilis]KAI8371646.1 profilin [Radiomyces spectabilis]